MSRARVHAISIVGVCFLLAAALAGQQIVISGDGSMARDANAPPAGTAVILGRTVDASSGKPIAGVVVSLTLMGTQSASYQPVLSDDQGRFVVRDLPKGGFRFYAVKPGYVPGAYSKRLPIGEANYFGQLMDVTDGQRATDITITLWKYAVIDGKVTDENGDPIVGISVRALPRRIVAGRSQFAMETSAIPFGTFTARTDDRGMYRLDSLPPGDYVVAVPVITWSAPKGARPGSPAPADATYSSSLGLGSWGGGGGRSGGAGNVDAGDDTFALVELPGSANSSPSSLAGFTADGRPLVYETQYFSNSTSLGRAAAVTIASGESRSAVDFRLRAVPASKISGVASGPDGPAANLTLRLVSAEMSQTSSDPEVAVTTADGAGRFVFLGVTPGQYAIRALNVPRPPPTRATTSTSTVQSSGGGGSIFLLGGASPAIPDAPTLFTDTPVTVGDREVKDVAVVLRPGFRVSGRVEFDGTADHTPTARMPSVSIIRADGQRGTYYTVQVGRLDEQWRLTTYGQVPGQYLVQMSSAPPGWYFAGAFLGGRDVSIVPLDLTAGDVNGVVIKLTDKPLGSITGAITNTRGQPDAGATALVFPADRALWINNGPSPRNLRAVGTGRDGRYVADNLPAGDYLVAAVTDLPQAWADPKSLESLARAASHVTLRDHDTATADLRTAAARGGTVSEVWSRGLAMDADGLGAGRAIAGHGPFIEDDRDQQPRDTPAAPLTGTARIAGVVSTGAEGRTPAAHVVVTLSGTAAFGMRTIITNETGRFDFAGLPAGRYIVAAAKPAYLSTSYGATKVGGAGTTLVLADGQPVTNVALTIHKGGVITGIIRDERGQPMPGAVAQVLQYRTQTNGERRLGSAGGAAAAKADDRGIYRIFGLPPGEYFIAASANYVAGNAHPTSAADVQFALQGGPAASSAAPAPKMTSQRFVPVLHPSAITAEGAQSIKLGLSEERTGIDVLLRLVPTVSVEGRVANSAGPLPANVEVRLLSVGESVPSAGTIDIISILPVRPRPDGGFSFTGIAPGKYVVAAMTQAVAGRAGRGGAADASPSLWGTTPVEVNGVDVSNVMVSLQPGMTVSGKLRFDATTLAAPADLSTVRVSLSPVLSTGDVAMGQTSATPAADGSFTFTGLTPGRYTLRATPVAADARGWQITAVSAGAQDATDAPFELKPGENVADALIVFGDRPAEITGTLQDTSGRAATDYFVILLPADPAKWRSTNRRVQQVRPSSDGQFAFRTLLAGDYLLAAATDVEPGATADPEFLTELSRSAVKVTVAEGEKKVQPLKIGK